MNQAFLLRLTPKFLAACEQFNIEPITAIENFTIYFTPISILARIPGNDFELASKIINHGFEKRPAREIDESIRKIHDKYVNRIRHLVLSDFNIDKEDQYLDSEEMEYENLINEWFSDVEDEFVTSTIYTSDGTAIDIPKGLNILSIILPFTALELIQYYVDHVDISNRTDEESIHTYASKFFMITNSNTK